MSNRLLAAVAVAASLVAASAAQASTVFASMVDVSGAGAGIGWDAELGDAPSTARTNPANMLGAPDSVPGREGGFYSLNGGVAVFGFGTNFFGDANIFEVTFSCSGSGERCSNHPESVDVYAFAGAYNPFDGAFGLGDLLSRGFSFVGNLGNGTAQRGGSITVGGPFSFLALVDNSSTPDGFDIDAISVSAVPVPASALFLLAGLGGLGFLRSRRKA